MQRCCECILSEVIQSEKRRKSCSSHTSHQSALLGIETVRPDTLVSHQMKRLVLIRVVGLLEDCHIVHTTLMQIAVFIDIDRIDLNPDIFKILFGDLYRLANIMNIGVGPALTRQHQDLLHTGFGDHLHLMLDLLETQFLAADVVVTVKSTVNAVVLTIIGDVEWCKNIYRISKMIFRDLLRFSRHLLQIWCCCRREKSFKILDRAGLIGKRPLHIGSCVDIIIVCIHGFEHLFLDIRSNDLHSLHIFHMVRAEGRILFQSVLAL